MSSEMRNARGAESAGITPSTFTSSKDERMVAQSDAAQITAALAGTRCPDAAWDVTLLHFFDEDAEVWRTAVAGGAMTGDGQSPADVLREGLHTVLLGDHDRADHVETVLSQIPARWYPLDETGRELYGHALPLALLWAIVFPPLGVRLVHVDVDALKAAAAALVAP